MPTTHPTPDEIRELILEIAESNRPRGPGSSSLQFNTIRTEIRSRMGGSRLPQSFENEVLIQWHELLRTGYFAPGANLDNPELPFFIITDRGDRALERLSRDPGNPEGYWNHLNEATTLNDIARSYLKEALACYNTNLNKAAAVMIGAAAESLILELRDAIMCHVATLHPGVVKGLADWRIKIVLDNLAKVFETHRDCMDKGLREQMEAYFPAFAQQIRAARNEAGHPSSVDPVTEHSVHASFLIFPELAHLTRSLIDWSGTLTAASSAQKNGDP
jgi:hypothetical protein